MSDISNELIKYQALANRMANLDSDLLRVFAAVADAGSVTTGAAKIFKTQSAASLQIRKLETIVGRALFERHGRGVTLTDAGHRLLPVARDVVAQLDGVQRDFSVNEIRGKLHLAIPDDQGRTRLAQIIGFFTQSHPLVDLEVTCTLSTGSASDLRNGHLDIAVYEVRTPGPDEDVLMEDPTCWVASSYQELPASAPLPVALFDRACWWRDAAVESLEARGQPYRIVYSSQSAAGVIAAVEAGVGVGLLGRSSLREGLRELGNSYGFGKTPISRLVLGTGKKDVTAATNAMRSAIRSAFHT